MSERPGVGDVDDARGGGRSDPREPVEPSSPGGAVGTAGASLLSPKTLHGLAPLELRARVVADALWAGGHRSRRFGSSSEFAEHKVYAPGDDLRRLDWKVMGRLDKSYVRRTEDETRIDVVVVVDTSRSMAYAGGARGALSTSKLEVARTLAAAVTYVALHRGDAPGLSLFAGGERAQLPPRGRGDALAQVCAALVAVQADGQTALQDALERVCERVRKKTVVVVISDFVDCGGASLDALAVLRRRGGDALVLQVLHEDEVDFPFDGVVKFEDLEGSREVQVDAPLVRGAYLDELHRFLAAVEAAVGRADGRYALVRGDRPVVEPLAHVLGDARAAGRR
ncbi:MAG: DUF58 domain-containing protein [Deltaproteobacteria bacterium]|nr:DUF58 domain-containing protein [Deltaproteobacteria bacterium]